MQGATTRAEDTGKEAAPLAGWGVLSALVIGYVGLYLCRKNLAVAVPLLQDEWHLTKEQAGRIASFGTVSYAIGKVITGRAVDRIGGRTGYLLSLGLVSLFGAVSVFAPGYWTILSLYSINRFVGSGAWGGMMKLTPTWFPARQRGTATAILCLGYVLGGVVATLVARQIVAFGGGVRAVMGVPGFFVAPLLVACAFVVREGPLEKEGARAKGGEKALGTWAAYRVLFGQTRFVVVCGLSFVLTLMRETFAVWNVDYLTTLQGAQKNITAAALQSIGFDLAGAAAILLVGWLYDRISPSRRRWFVTGLLVLLAGVLFALPWTAGAPFAATLLVAAVGLLAYGPYSLFTGVMAVESGGPRLAATAAGLIDAAGYVGAALSGSAFGKLLDLGGYSLGFRALAGLTLAAAWLSTRLK